MVGFLGERGTLLLTGRAGATDIAHVDERDVERQASRIEGTLPIGRFPCQFGKECQKNTISAWKRAANVEH